MYRVLYVVRKRYVDERVDELRTEFEDEKGIVDKLQELMKKYLPEYVIDIEIHYVDERGKHWLAEFCIEKEMILDELPDRVATLKEFVEKVRESSTTKEPILYCYEEECLLFEANVDILPQLFYRLRFIKMDLPCFEVKKFLARNLPGYKEKEARYV